MIKNYIKVAWRNLIKNRLSSFINVFGLTLGISVCVTILIFVRYESTFDAFHKKADLTYRIVQHSLLPNQTLYWNTTAYPLAEALRNDFPEINQVTQISGPVSRVLKVEDALGNENLFEEPEILFVDEYYPKTFDLIWLAGNENTALREINSVVLTETMAKRYFQLGPNNYSNALGKTIYLQNDDPLTVTGVIKSPKGNSDHQYNMLIPYKFFITQNSFFSENWSANHQGTTYVVLNNTASKGALESKIADWKKKYLNPQNDKRISYYLQPLKEIHNETLYGPSPGGYILPKNILSISTVIALFILLIALINFVNLATAQSYSRSKEVGIRKVVGSERRHLILQFIFENSLVIVLASLISIIAIKGLLMLLNDYLTVIDLQLRFLPEHFLYIILTAIIAMLLAAVYPALFLSSFEPIKALRNKFDYTKVDKVNLRRSLVTFQFVVVQLFVIAAIVLAFQVSHFKSNDLGFHRDTVVITKSSDYSKSKVYKEKLLAESAVSKVSFGSGPPMAVNGLQLGTNYRLPKQSEEESLAAEMKMVDTEYLDFYGLQLLAGRNFTLNKEAFDEFIVNETFLKPYGWTPEEAIGQQIQINEGIAKIVGVVKDFHNNSLQYDITPCVLVNWTYYLNSAFIKLNDADYISLATIKTNWEEIYPNAIYSYQFLDDAIAKEYTVENMIFAGFGVFSILSILIGCLGLLGLMSFMVSKKSREIGIRKVLGASLLENVSLFSKEYIKLVGLSFVIAAPLVHYFMSLWLEGFSYRIQLSFWMFLFGGLVTLLIAVITCSIQSIKASLVNPIKSLRTE
ncbi:ABC transporter permease [Flagellimonas onchidii]|uniref:ABC transporter permease n=1 Tax=Flagellimonas onchidii TaxID=2562684 RepID=UPI0010A5E342|nr:ABC transporter permease [Allomuricauda onchidii]